MNLGFGSLRDKSLSTSLFSFLSLFVPCIRQTKYSKLFDIVVIICSKRPRLCDWVPCAASLAHIVYHKAYNPILRGELLP